MSRIEEIYSADKSKLAYINKRVITVEQQAEKLIDEAYQYAPSSGVTKEAISISIAIWCAEKIASNIGFSVNGEYWADVIKYLNNKR